MAMILIWLCSWMIAGRRHLLATKSIMKSGFLRQWQRWLKQTPKGNFKSCQSLSRINLHKERCLTEKSTNLRPWLNMRNYSNYLKKVNKKWEKFATFKIKKSCIKNSTKKLWKISKALHQGSHKVKIEGFLKRKKLLNHSSLQWVAIKQWHLLRNRSSVKGGNIYPSTTRDGVVTNQNFQISNKDRLRQMKAIL